MGWSVRHPRQCVGYIDTLQAARATSSSCQTLTSTVALGATHQAFLGVRRVSVDD
jgi:hypothetical protein